MDEKEIKPNSHKYKDSLKEQEESREMTLPKNEKVISGTAIKKKKSGPRKFIENFLAEDIKDIGSYIFDDVIVPNIKTLVCNGVSDAINMLLWGKAGYQRNNSSVRYAGGAKPRVAYNKVSERGPTISRRSSAYSFDDLVLAKRSDAEEILCNLDEQLYSYGMVSVGDLYEFAGLTPNWTDHNYGWTDLRGANIVRDPNGWCIKMPKAIPIREIRGN